MAHRETTIFTMSTCHRVWLVLFGILAAIQPIHGETPESLSIQFLDDPCKFSIRLSNVSDKKREFVASFGTDEYAREGVPAFTLIYVRDQQGKVVSGIPGREEQGYTWLIFHSQIPEYALHTLEPGKSLAVEYPLKRLCFGLFEETGVLKSEIGKYEIKLKTKVYLDKGMERAIEAETPWTKFPPCLAE